MLFTHMTHEIGTLCVDCYMRLHGSCGVCGNKFIPNSLKEETTYQIKVKFIKTGEKAIIMCSSCYEAIKQDYPELMA